MYVLYVYIYIYENTCVIYMSENCNCWTPKKNTFRSNLDMIMFALQSHHPLNPPNRATVSAVGPTAELQEL